MPVALAVGGLVVVAVVVALVRSPRETLPPPASAPSCASTSDCAAGFRCVVPGVCSRVCNANADCPAGRRCAELRAMEPGGEDSATPGVATTCVSVTPG